MIFNICSKKEFCKEIAELNEREKVEYEESDWDFAIFEKKKEIEWIEDMRDIKEILTKSKTKK